MTATDELRRMLDERGVEWVAGTPIDNYIFSTFWLDENGVEWRAVGVNSDCETLRTAAHITPAQAIEATLGPREQPPYDELIEALRRDWDIEASWDGLRRFWYVGLTDEGVRKRDEREATLGRGECHNASNVTDKHGQARFVCSACNAWLDSRMLWNPEYPNGESPFVKDCRLNFCPNCGRKVVDE